jgi:hypothetical protein
MFVAICRGGLLPGHLVGGLGQRILMQRSGASKQETRLSQPCSTDWTIAALPNA